MCSFVHLKEDIRIRKALIRTNKVIQKTEQLSCEERLKRLQLFKLKRRNLLEGCKYDEGLQKS